MTRLRNDPEPFECDARAKAETAKALLVRLETGDEKWVPKSVIDDDSEVWKKGDSGKLIIMGWWAEQEGLA